MLNSDRKAFLDVVIGFAELKGKALSAPALNLYWAAMEHWDLDEFKSAANHLLRSCEFMPTPADFEKLRKAARPTQGEAWASVLQHLRGGYRQGGLTPEIDAAVRALGGYRALAVLSDEQLHWQAKRFAEHYGEAAAVAETRAALGYDPEPAVAWRLPPPPGGPKGLARL